MNDKKWKFAFFSIVFILLILSIFSFKNREYDWDMPGYLAALIVSNGETNPKVIHYKTYSEIKSEAPSASYNKLIGIANSNHATFHFAKNYKYFNEQIPYYQVKVGYNLFIRGLNFIGFSGPTSILLVNSISYLLSGILLFIALKYILPEYPIYVTLLTCIIISLPPLFYISTIASPDMLGLMFLLFFFNLLIRRKKDSILFLVLVILVLCRPDYSIFALTYLFINFVYTFYTKKKLKYPLLFQILIIFGIYYSIVNYYQYPSWSDVFYDSFINRRYSISEQPIVLSFDEYLNVLLKNIVNFKKVSLVSIMILFISLYFSKSNFHRIISLLLFFNIYLKFLFFPAPGELRFFIGFILLLFLWMIYCIVNTNKKVFNIS